METAQAEAVRGIVNERTQPVKHERGAADYETDCNLMWHVTPDDPRRAPTEQATEAVSVRKPGVCFEDGGEC